MKQSQIFTKTRFESPKEEVSKNALMLIRSGFIHKDMAGVYSLLPFGLRVLNKIVGIVREEMNAIGGQEVSLAALQNKDLWEKTGRWDDKVVDNWFKSKFANGTETGFGFTHEEPITNMLKDHIRSYKDLPVGVFQFQTKFRNETRAKSGILRTREFLMKDFYSFCKDQKEQDMYYEKAKDAYKRIFHRVGIGDRTYMTFATGGVFSEYSHEFQTETDSGEDTIYVDLKSKIAVNKEVMKPEVLKNLGLDKEKLVEKKAIEVGNIFNLGTKFSSELGLSYTDEKGGVHPVVMGCYGIGIGRLMGTIVEVYARDGVMIWPKEVSPFDIHIISIANGDPAVSKEAEDLYQKLQSKGLSPLYDDRDMRAGEKFADADLIGVPIRIVVSKKTMEAKKYEVVELSSNKTTNASFDEIIEMIKR